MPRHFHVPLLAILLGGCLPSGIPASGDDLDGSVEGGAKGSDAGKGKQPAPASNDAGTNTDPTDPTDPTSDATGVTCTPASGNGNMCACAVAAASAKNDVPCGPEGSGRVCCGNDDFPDRAGGSCYCIDFGCTSKPNLCECNFGSGASPTKDCGAQKTCCMTPNAGCICGSGLGGTCSAGSKAVPSCNAAAMECAPNYHRVSSCR